MRNGRWISDDDVIGLGDAKIRAPAGLAAEGGSLTGSREQNTARPTQPAAELLLRTKSGCIRIATSTTVFSVYVLVPEHLIYLHQCSCWFTDVRRRFEGCDEALFSSGAYYSTKISPHKGTEAWAWAWALYAVTHHKLSRLHRSCRQVYHVVEYLNHPHEILVRHLASGSCNLPSRNVTSKPFFSSFF